MAIDHNETLSGDEGEVHVSPNLNADDFNVGDYIHVQYVDPPADTPGPPPYKAGTIQSIDDEYLYLGGQGNDVSISQLNQTAGIEVSTGQVAKDRFNDTRIKK